MKYTVNLNVNELYNLADELEKYADTFEDKVKEFLSRLADVGISVAQANGGVFGSYIVYSKEFKDNTTLYMVANGEPIVRTWYISSKATEARQETISPVLMAEFGSGNFAIEATGEASGLGGKGTLNLYGHADDVNGWYWWADEMRDGELKKVKDGRFLFHSEGLPPYQPLHKAVMACIEQVEGIAQEVFR